MGTRASDSPGLHVQLEPPEEDLPARHHLVSIQSGVPPVWSGHNRAPVNRLRRRPRKRLLQLQPLLYRTRTHSRDKTLGFLSVRKLWLESQSRFYNAKWNLFVGWAEARNVVPEAPSIPDITDFFMFLYHERKLQPETIQGYRTALADRLDRSTGLDVASSVVLSRLKKSFFPLGTLVWFYTY